MCAREEMNILIILIIIIIIMVIHLVLSVKVRGDVRPYFKLWENNNIFECSQPEGYVHGLEQLRLTREDINNAW